MVAGSVTLFVLAFGTCEVIFRAWAKSGGGDGFVEYSAPMTVFAVFDDDAGEQRFKVTHPEMYPGAARSFPVEKPRDAFRVFRLGGSASAGWPLPPSENAGRLLEAALERAYPPRVIEVIDASAHAYASYRVRRIFDRVMEFEPDLIVIHSGNNEYLEKRSYLVDSWLVDLLRKSHLIRWIHERRAGRAVKTLRGDKKGSNLYHVWTKLERQATEIRTDPIQHRGVVDHFEHSIAHMVREAQRASVPVFLLTVPVNLRDWRPNVSCNGLTGEKLSAWGSSALGRLSGQRSQACPGTSIRS